MPISAAPVLTRMDSLFIIAATGEPRFQNQRDSAENLLIVDSTTPAYLIAHRLIGQTPRQRHYVEHLFTAITNSKRPRACVAQLGEAISTAADSLKSQLLHIGSELGDNSFLLVARLYLEVDSQEVRKSAVRSLGMYPDSQDLPWLLNRIEKTQGLERQENLWALSRHGAVKDWPRLLSLLRDEWLYNRQLAHRVLDSAVAGDWNKLARHVPAQPDLAERLEWVLLALDFQTPAAQAYLKKELAKLSPKTRAFVENSQKSAGSPSK